MKYLALLNFLPAIFDLALKIEEVARLAKEKVDGAAKKQALIDLLKLSADDKTISVVGTAIDLVVGILNSFKVFSKTATSVN